MEGRVLFSTVGTGAMQTRNIESFDFGVAPLPKYDEIQKNYYCFLGLNHFAIPVTIQDTDMTGDTLEALAYLTTDISSSKRRYRNRKFSKNMRSRFCESGSALYLRI